MSRQRERELLAQREQLLLRSAELRLSLRQQATGLEPALRWAERAHAGWEWLRAHPEGPLAAALLLVILRPRRALRWGLRLWSGVRLLRRLQGLAGLAASR